MEVDIIQSQMHYIPTMHLLQPVAEDYTYQITHTLVVDQEEVIMDLLDLHRTTRVEEDLCLVLGTMAVVHTVVTVVQVQHLHRLVGLHYRPPQHLKQHIHTHQDLVIHVLRTRFETNIPNMPLQLVEHKTDL